MSSSPVSSRTRGSLKIPVFENANGEEAYKFMENKLLKGTTLTHLFQIIANIARQGGKENVLSLWYVIIYDKLYLGEWDKIFDFYVKLGLFYDVDDYLNTISVHILDGYDDLVLDGFDYSKDKNSKQFRNDVSKLLSKIKEFKNGKITVTKHYKTLLIKYFPEIGLTKRVYNSTKIISHIKNRNEETNSFVKKCNNNNTSLMGTKWEDIPKERRYGPIDGYCYDISELLNDIERQMLNGKWPTYAFTRKKIPLPIIRDLLDKAQKNNISHSFLVAITTYIIEKGYLNSLPVKYNSSKRTTNLDIEKIYYLLNNTLEKIETNYYGHV